MEPIDAAPVVSKTNSIPSLIMIINVVIEIENTFCVLIEPSTFHSRFSLIFGPSLLTHRTKVKMKIPEMINVVPSKIFSGIPVNPPNAIENIIANTTLAAIAKITPKYTYL